MTFALDPFELVLEDLRRGKPIVLVDDRDRENEGDITIAAEMATPEVLAFMLNHGKGLICISLTEQRLRELQLPMQVTENSSSFGTNFAVSFDLRAVGELGETAEGRSRTILAAADESVSAEEFVIPGYVFPVCAVAGGVLKRRGQTEGSVDICRIAGLKPAGVICEIMGSDGVMLRGERLQEFCRDHGLLVSSVEEIARYRLQNEISIRRVGQFELTSVQDLARVEQLRELLGKLPEITASVYSYTDDVDEQEHWAVVIGEPDENALVRIHSECLTGDVFQSLRCDCGDQLDQALGKIFSAGAGVLIYLHQEGRGIGLGNKLRAYQLQDQGLDTVDANIHLGFEPDQRDYRVGAQILNDLKLKKVRLMTNNPAKLESLTALGIVVSERVAITVAEDVHSAAYLETKRRRMGHLLPK